MHFAAASPLRGRLTRVAPHFSAPKPSQPPWPLSVGSGRPTGSSAHADATGAPPPLLPRSVSTHARSALQSPSRSPTTRRWLHGTTPLRSIPRLPPATWRLFSRKTSHASTLQAAWCWSASTWAAHGLISTAALEVVPQKRFARQLYAQTRKAFGRVTAQPSGTAGTQKRAPGTARTRSAKHKPRSRHSHILAHSRRHSHAGHQHGVSLPSFLPGGVGSSQQPRGCDSRQRPARQREPSARSPLGSKAGLREGSARGAPGAQHPRQHLRRAGAAGAAPGTVSRPSPYGAAADAPTRPRDRGFGAHLLLVFGVVSIAARILVLLPVFAVLAGGQEDDVLPVVDVI